MAAKHRGGRQAATQPTSGTASNRRLQERPMAAKQRGGRQAAYVWHRLQ